MGIFNIIKSKSIEKNDVRAEAISSNSQEKTSADIDVKVVVNVESQDIKPSSGSCNEATTDNDGKLDMVIAFDTTGSMIKYIDAVKNDVAQLIPQLFKENEDLRLGIVAFGDYCDMLNPQVFGKAYQVISPTDNVDELIQFVKTAKNTSGGDGDEFYELVLKKIVEETPWREGSTRSVLLIADAEPHPVGYSYGHHVYDNQIDWREEARKAAEKGIKIDTVRISTASWYEELSRITGGVSAPFRTGYKTSGLIKASVMSRGSKKARKQFDVLMDACEQSNDDEMKAVYLSYKKVRDSFGS